MFRHVTGAIIRKSSQYLTCRPLNGAFYPVGKNSHTSAHALKSQLKHKNVHNTNTKTAFLFNKTNRRTNFPNLFLSRNSTCFGHFLCPWSGIFHCTFGTGICHAGLMTAFKHHHPGRAWNLSSNLHDIYQCRRYSGKFLMMDRETARNM